MGKCVDSCMSARTSKAVSVWAATAISLAALLAAYLLVWQRGFYSDDYSNLDLAVDADRNAPRPLFSPVALPWYPARLLGMQLHNSLALGLEHCELAVRRGCAAGVALAALLLGLLVGRATGSRVAGLVAGWFVLTPAWAYEAVLWPGAAMYILAAVFGMSMLHCGWSALVGVRAGGSAKLRFARPGARQSVAVLDAKQSFAVPSAKQSFALPGKTRSVAARVGWSAAAVGFFGLMLLTGEQFVSLAGLLLPLGLLAGWRAGAGAWRARLVHAAVLLALMAGLSLAWYGMAYRGGSLVSARGGVTVTSAALKERGRALARSLRGRFGPYHRDVYAEALRRGSGVLAASPAGLALAAVGVASLGMVIASWPRARTAASCRGNASEPERSSGLSAFVLGLSGWAFATIALFFPAILVSEQGLENRMFYLPSFGVALVLGALAAWTCERWPSPWVGRSWIGLAGAGLAVSAVTMLGFASTLARRYALDCRQIEAIASALAGADLPPRTRLLPIRPEEAIFDEETPLGRSLVGVMEQDWALRSALRRRVGHRELEATCANRWAAHVFDVQPGGAGEPARLTLHGAAVDVNTALPFTYREGRVMLVGSVTLTGPQADQRFEFPLALRAAGVGGATLALICRAGDEVDELVLPPGTAGPAGR